MKLTGILMEEHRLIERMMALMAREARKIEKEKIADLPFIARAVDFIRMYADKTHHNKEESILFREAAKKVLAPDHRALLQELLAEHDFGRKTVGELIEAREGAGRGEQGALATILGRLNALTGLYREHIRKEDQVFFPAVLGYFSALEQEAMIREFWEADRKMIHMVYQAVVQGLEQGGG